MESVKDRDAKFVSDFLVAAMEIVSQNSSQQSPKLDKCSFMLMPKKVNKVSRPVLMRILKSPC